MQTAGLMWVLCTRVKVKVVRPEAWIKETLPLCTRVKVKVVCPEAWIKETLPLCTRPPRPAYLSSPTPVQ